MTQARSPAKENPPTTIQLWQQVLRLGVQLLAPRAGKYPTSEDLEAKARAIRSAAGEILGGQVELWLSPGLLPGLGDKPGLPGTGSVLVFPAAPDSALMRLALSARQTRFEPSEDRPGALAVPLLIPGEAQKPGAPLGGSLGVLQVTRDSGASFSPEEVALAEGLAAQAAMALQVDQQMAIERWRVEQLSLVRKVSVQIADVRDLDELARRICLLILQTFKYYFVAIFTLDPGRPALTFRASAGPPQAEGATGTAPLGAAPAIPIRLGEGMVGATALTGQEILANDVDQESRYRYTDSLPETRAEFTLPLKVGDRVLGVLDVQSDQPGDFHEIDVLVLRALAGNIAVAVDDAGLYAALRRRAGQLSTIAEVSQAITSILDQEELLEEVVGLIQRRFGFRFVHVFTVHPGRRMIFYEAGPRPTAAGEERFAYNLDDPQGIIPWVARNGQTVLANDVDHEPRYRPSPLPPDETRAELAVPLIFAGEVLGVLDVQSDQENAFGEDDRFLFEALADVVAVALRNAYLYRSEAWRRRVGDSLLEVAGLLSAEADLDQVLEAILAELEAALPCDLAAIWLVDEEVQEAAGLEPGEEANPLPLQLAAIHGRAAGQLGEIDMSLSLEGANGERGPASWLLEAFQAEQALVRSPAAPFEPLGAALSFPADYSAVAAPLQAGDQRLGLLVLIHRTAGRYGSEARAMTAAFASYAAVAIENTRLYEAAHEQAWVSTVLLQVAEATQAITNLNELLATVARITPMLVGVRACALYLVDDDQVFVPAASSGLRPDQQAEFERWRFAPGDVPALDELRSNRLPVLLHGGAENSRLLEILSGGRTEDGEDPGEEVLALAPLAARGETQGALLVTYSADLLLASASETLFDERLAIVQGIAHQTAIAVDNIRLEKAQKEEAYVSVALLQVAQAIVSTNDLDEILGSIVRITPILVGVKRALIYLWDEDVAAFRLAEAYGLPRGSEGQIIGPQDFPLVAAAWREDRLLAAPLEGGGEAEPPAAWMAYEPVEAATVANYLETEPCLLLAIPLSVKGSVLGVLLVEEPEPAGAEGPSGGTFNSRLREKRLEITTGISQQAALAIQNDRLQRERLERERLEREMQLAREIQRAFLPAGLPDLPGWDLSVRWRTAREVGGDFYDYFDLPGRRLGLVIADVADKGMPAALFMTLTRTLVRATVQDAESPSEVLARVNDVIAPDAREGMFVTLVYAVLDLDSGELVYANAGHNLPLWARANRGEVALLERGGMALGVQEGNAIPEHRLRLEVGDILIFYTDGLTEAFAADGEMFGEARLRRVTAEAVLGAGEEAMAAPRAAEVLDALEERLSDFTHGAPLEDDLTIMALKRVEAGYA